MEIHPIFLNSAKAVQTNWSSSGKDPVTSSPLSPDIVKISEEARSALAESGKKTNISIETRLAKIQAEDASEKTDEDIKYILAYDSKYLEIIDKEYRKPGSLTSSEVDYMQKTIGFVNTMSALNEDEKRLYDEIAASGNTAATSALSNIAAIRLGGHIAAGRGSTTYDPTTTAITAENILKYFRHSVEDNIGKADADFLALAEYLENRSTQLVSNSTKYNSNG